MNKYVVAISVLLALLTGCSEKPEKQEPVALQKLALDIEAGKAVAQKTCSACHGMDGRGVQDNIPNLAAQLDAYLLKAVQTYDHGKRAGSSGDIMKLAQELTPAQLRNVLGYYASLPPLSNPGNNSARYSYYGRGEQLSKPCVGCHGSDGNPREAGVPRLAGQHPQYIIKAAKAYRGDKRSMPAMHEKLAGLSQADIENIAIYFALNTPKSAVSKASNPNAGKQFTMECVKCHGPAGASDETGIPNLAGQDVKYLNSALKSYRDQARDHGVMHQKISELKDSEIEKIAVYFASEPAAKISFIPPEPIETIAQQCDLCHKLGSANPDMLTPRLAGQNRGYLINALTAYRDGDRGNSAMHKTSTTLYFDATIEGIAAYYSEQTGK